MRVEGRHGHFEGLKLLKPFELSVSLPVRQNAFCGGRRGTRTPKSLRTLRPERSASTNFAIRPQVTIDQGRNVPFPSLIVNRSAPLFQDVRSF